MLGLNLMIPNPRFEIPTLLQNPITPSSRRLPTAPRFRHARRRMACPRAEKGDSKGKGEKEEEGGGKSFRLNVKWGELLLNPDPDNVAAVGLAGLLTWASVQVLWQLVIVSAAILIAALKYSFIAALLLFILIALL